MAKSDVAKLLEFNKNAEWVAKVNCYGFALGVDLEERNVLPHPDVGPQPGEFSRKFRDPKIVGALPQGHDVRYALLADGLIPVSVREGLTADGHMIAAIDHHFFRRVAPRRWLHKMGGGHVRADYGSQKKITDINLALTEYATLSGPAAVYGFFRMPEDRLRLGATAPPSYHPATSKELAAYLEILWELPSRRSAIEAEVKALGLDPELPKRFAAGEPAMRLRAAISQHLRVNPHGM